jgi:hypothetical protein
VVFWDAALPQSRAFGRYGRTKHQARARGGLPLMHENAEPVSKLIDLSPIHQFCPVSPLDRTKLFHVKHFSPIDACANAPSRLGAMSGTAIWGLRNSAIILGFGFVTFLTRTGEARA